MSAADLSAMWTMYGDAGGNWTGGDGTTSVTLPDGRLVWLFSHTFLGTVNADHSRPSSTPLVGNSVVVQEGTDLTATLHGGSAEAPDALVKPTQDGEFLWVGDAIVEAGALKVLYHSVRKTGSGVLDFTYTRTSLATFSLPALTLDSLVNLPLDSEVVWGADLLSDGDYTYIYGTSSAPGRMRFGHVARVSTGNLNGPWQFWTGSEWSADSSAAGRLLSGVGASYSVQKVGAQYVLVTHENNLLSDSRFVAYTAASPTGPFTGPDYLFTAPEPQPGSNTIVYNAHLHPELASSGKLLMSYNVNSLKYSDTLADVRLYRPRFVDITWPPPAPGAGLPAAPLETTVSGQDDYAELAWPAVTGANSYRVYQRDVTGGQTHFAQLPAEPTTTSHRASLLIPGHQYEFKVSAVNNVGEGAYSPTVAVTPQSTKPVADAIGDANVPEAIAGSYIVGLKGEAAQPERVASYASQLVAQAGGTLGPVMPYTLRGFGATLTQAQAVNLAAHPDVLDVEQNTSFEVDGTQIDPPWHLDRVDQRDRLPSDQKYEYPNDGSVRAYVLDSGIRATHSEFGGRVTTGHNVFDGSANTDDCGEGHGTAVASALGGATYGVAKSVQIVPVKVLTCNADGKPVANKLSVVHGVEWATGDAKDKKPAVMNLSVGKAGVNKQNERAIQTAIGAGLVVVTSAGNAASDACTRTPARLSRETAVITTGASDILDRAAIFSGYGPCVTLYAPGVGIASAGITSDTETVSKNGTSFAAPQVAGAAAMLLEAHPDYSPTDVKAALVNAASKDKLTGVQTSPNLLLYIESAPTVAPTNLTATAADDGTINLAWTGLPDQNVHYLVSWRDVTVGEGEFRRWPSPVVNATTAVAEYLLEGHLYEFRVAAANSIGTGPESNVASATSHLAPPVAPTGLTATGQVDGTVKLVWTAPAGEVWHKVYQRDVTAGEGEFTAWPLPVTEGATAVAQYLAHGHEYEFKVSATNAGGEGPASNVASARSTYPTPAAPTNLTIAAGDGQAGLSWTASTTPNVWYAVYFRDVTNGETEFTAWELPVTECCTATATLLANGHEYEFKVTTTAAGGESGPSNLVRVVPQPPVPGQVTGLAATANTDGSISLSWSAPGSGDFWYDIYQRDVTAGQTSFTKLPLPVTTCCTFKAQYLTHNHAYEFKVAATNGRVGPLSAAAGATSRYSLPAAPANLRGVAAGNGMIDLTWDAPGSCGCLYWVYWRDVTAGQTSFTKGIYPVNDTSVSMGPLVHQHVYEFKVSADNQGGEGPVSTAIRVTSLGGLPAPPSGLTAEAGDGRAVLRWTASPTSGVGYTVYQRDITIKQSWQKLPLPVSGTSMTANYLTNGHDYEFKVTASNASGESAASNVAEATPMPPLPQPPTGLTAAGGDGKVTLNWTASTTPNVWYWIELRAKGSDWRRLDLPLTTCCNFTVNYLANGTTYEFRVKANNMKGDSAPSNVDDATPMPPWPQPPSGLSATEGDGKVTLRWTASPTPNVWYWIEMRVSGNPNWQRLPYPVSTCCTFTVNYLANGTTYDFRIRATNLRGDSTPSNTDTAKPMPPFPASPSNLQGIGSNSEAYLSWRASSTPRVLYNVYMRSHTSNGPWVKLALPTTSTSLTMKYLQYGHTYEFKVTATNQSGESSPSNTVSVLIVAWSSARQCAEVTSSWIFNDAKGFKPVQLYDVTGRICGTRSNYSFRMDTFWSTAGRTVYSGTFVFDLVDCDTMTTVWSGMQLYGTGTSLTSFSETSYVGLNPNKVYRLEVWGSGEISTRFNGVFGRYGWGAPPGIIPFWDRTTCF